LLLLHKSVLINETVHFSLHTTDACIAQPTLAKLMDVFGRMEVLLVSIVFYLIGVSTSISYLREKELN